MADKAIDPTTKILRKIQADLLAFRRDMDEFRREVNFRFDSIEDRIAGTAEIVVQGRGIAERLKERVRRLEDRKA